MRLTYQNADGSFGVHGVDMKRISAAAYGALCKLKDYEDTGLEPSQLYRMDEAYQDMCRELAELKKAEVVGYRKIIEQKKRANPKRKARVLKKILNISFFED